MISGYMESGETITNEMKCLIAEWYLTHYKKIKAQDIYRWIWEGEFGARRPEVDLSLYRLKEEIRAALIHGRKTNRVWEPVGLAMTQVKINLLPYSDHGCPLNRLLMFEERGRDVRPNPMRLKHDWALMKSQLSLDMNVTPENMKSYEDSIAFHLIPEAAYSEDYVEEYGTGYRIVPRYLFFDYFPEYKMEEKEYILKNQV